MRNEYRVISLLKCIYPVLVSLTQSENKDTERKLAKSTRYRKSICSMADLRQGVRSKILFNIARNGPEVTWRECEGEERRSRIEFI